MGTSQSSDYFLRSGNPGLECHVFQLVAADGDLQTIQGDGGQLVASVTKDDTGEFTVTFKNSWTKAVAVLPTIVVPGGGSAGAKVIVESFANEASGTPLTMHFFTENAAGAPTDPADGARVQFACFLQKGTFGTR